MMFKEPTFWWKKPGVSSTLLQPLSYLYGYIAARNMDRQPPAIDLPVLCVGNFTLGGTGKTPTVIALAISANEMGLTPGIVSRGYGAKNKNLHLVDPQTDMAEDVGDEALLLSRHAKVAIGSDRYAAAQHLQKKGCQFIIMDDGFQSRRLSPDWSLLVVDGMRGLGNGLIFPSGPLRAPLKKQLAYTDSLLIIGKGDEETILHLAADTAKPAEQAILQPFSNIAHVKGKRFFVFSGIGNPAKFHRSILEMGGIVAETQNFPDHYFFKNSDLEIIRKHCAEKNLIPATTAKDYVRLISQQQTQILDGLAVFDVNVNFSDKNFCKNLITATLERHNAKNLSSAQPS